MKFLRFATVVAIAGMTWSCSSPSRDQDNSEQSVTSPTEETETTPAQLTQDVEQGKTVYGQYCVTCHQTDGKGMSGAFPPLTQTKWVEGDKTELISVILNGMQGAITVNDEEYNNVMPSHSFLSDEDIAAVLTYVRQSFGNSSSEITTAEVTEVRENSESSSSAN